MNISQLNDNEKHLFASIHKTILPFNKHKLILYFSIINQLQSTFLFPVFRNCPAF